MSSHKKLIKFLILTTLLFIGGTHDLTAMLFVNKKEHYVACTICSNDHKPGRIITLACCNQACCVQCLGKRHAYCVAAETTSSCPYCRSPLFQEPLENNPLKIRLGELPTYQNALVKALRSKQQDEQRQLEEAQRRFIEETTIKLCPLCSTRERQKEAGRKLLCDHAFCTNCLVQHHAHCIKHGKPSTCPNPNCNIPLEDRLIMTLENKPSFKRIFRK